MRIALLTSLLLTACTVGDTGTATGPSNNGTPDAGSGPDSASSGTADLGPCVNRVPDAQVIPAYVHSATAGGGTNAGKNCIVGGCHLNSNRGQEAPGFQFAGTVYLQGTTNPAGGVTVRLKSETKTLDPVVTDTAGNFYFLAGGLPGTFTAITDVTGCPSVKPMLTKIQSAGQGANSCNLCHAPTAAGGTTTPIYY